MQYDDVGCSSMFQLTHSASSINSDASDRSSKSGTVRPLTSLQPLNPSTCPSSKVKLEKNLIICQKDMAASATEVTYQQVSLSFLFPIIFSTFQQWESNQTWRNISGGQMQQFATNKTENRCQDCNFYRTHVFVHGVLSLGPGVSKSH